MDVAKNPNLEILRLAVEQLDELSDEMVFVGGCATGLLITDQAAPVIRVTKDVDAIVQVTSKADYYRLSEKLRKKGFAEDTSDGAPLCRWITDMVVLDVMPTDPGVLGFSNRWYSPAIENAQTLVLTNEKKINMVSAPYFLITKLEAFDGRGNNDFLMSHDIEDFVAVIDGRAELQEEIKKSAPELVSELALRCEKLVKDARFVEAVSGHMPTDETSQARASIVLKIITQISELKC